MDIECSLSEMLEHGAAWLANYGEVLAVARFSRAAGSRDYELFNEVKSLQAWVAGLSPDTSLLLLKDYELSERGPASAVRLRIPDEVDIEWLVIVAKADRYSRSTSFECWGTAEVLDELAEYDDEYVIAGRMPGWNPAVIEHAPDILSTIVPRPDGTIHRGVY